VGNVLTIEPKKSTSTNLDQLTPAVTVIHQEEKFSCIGGSRATGLLLVAAAESPRHGARRVCRVPARGDFSVAKLLEDDSRAMHACKLVDGALLWITGGPDAPGNESISIRELQLVLLHVMRNPGRDLRLLPLQLQKLTYGQHLYSNGEAFSLWSEQDYVPTWDLAMVVRGAVVDLSNKIFSIVSIERLTKSGLVERRKFLIPFEARTGMLEVEDAENLTAILTNMRRFRPATARVADSVAAPFVQYTAFDTREGKMGNRRREFRIVKGQIPKVEARVLLDQFLSANDCSAPMEPPQVQGMG